MNPLVTGIHHVTAFAGDPSRNLRFYTRTLGFELVKRTVNFDAPGMWHLYYGLASGAAGTLLTHFPEPSALRASHGGSEIVSATIAVREGALGALAARLEAHGVRPDRVTSFDRATLSFEDADGMRILAEERTDPQQPAAEAEVARVTLAVPDAEATAAFLRTVMGFAEVGREGATIRLGLADRDGAIAGGSGREVDVVGAPELAPEPLAAGTIHHIAWRVAGEHAQADAARALTRAGIAVTPVRDRLYFRSIYFRIPGGVLFEIATDGPGFKVDEPAEALGRLLCLPAQFESRRARIESELPELRLPSE